MAFTRRFVTPPSTFTDIEAINILEVEPPVSILGVSVGTVGIVGEFTKGPFNTPKAITSGKELSDVFGGFSKYIAANGSGFVSVRNKRFGALVLVRPDLTLGNVTFTLSVAAPTGGVLIKAGTGLSNGSTFIVATAQDVTIVAGQTTGTVAVFQANGTTGTVLAAAVTTILDAPTLPTGTTVAVSNSAGLTALALAAIEAKYVTAIESTNTQDGDGSTINIITSARGGATINSGLKTNAVDFSLSGGKGRIAVAFSVPTTSKSAVVTQAVALGTSGRVAYTWPFLKTVVPEAGATLETPPGPWLAAIMSQLGPEQNPGQSTPFSAGITGLEEGLGTLTINDYITFKANGIAAFRFDRADGFIVQSGIMTDKTNITRRRMTDFIGESQAVALAPYNKKPSTQTRRTDITRTALNFLNTLLSVNNPAQQKIAGFVLDSTSGNTQELLDQGQFTLIEKIKILPSLDAITFQIQAGETVSIEEV